MRSKITLFLSSALILGGLSLPAFADKGHGMFERSDTDGDGVCGYTDYLDSGQKLFHALDTNGDGRLSPDEIQ